MLAVLYIVSLTLADFHVQISLQLRFSQLRPFHVRRISLVLRRGLMSKAEGTTLA